MAQQRGPSCAIERLDLPQVIIELIVSEEFSMASLLGLGSSAVVHLVCFKFQADAEPHLIKKTCESFLALANDCLNQKGSKYIKSIKAGKDVSIEGKSKGLTHAFVVTFASIADRDYYIKQDPIHASFVQVRVVPLSRCPTN